MRGAALNAFFAVAAAVFGLVFGSFANVVIWRLPRGESVVHPPSACPRCNTPIRPADNIPVVSWMRLRGRCRTCGEPISWRYPAVEALSALLWLAVALRFGPSAQAGFGFVFVYLLMILSFIDLDTMRLPNVLVGALAGVGAVGTVIAQLSGVAMVPLLAAPTPLLASPLVHAVVGIVVSAGVSLALAATYALLRKRSGFGMGDVKLLGAIGIFLGVYGGLVLFVGAIFGAVYGIVRGSRDPESMAKPFPFGPFLALAAVIVMLWGSQAISAYLSLFVA